jgi:formate/nitrite transporter FocA (FNT family)
MEKLGIVFLAVGTIFAIWSALMPSIFTISKFGIREGTEEDKQALLIAGILASIIIGLVVWSVWSIYFRRKE